MRLTAAGVLLGVAHNMRFEHSVRWFRERVAEGAIGNPLLARTTFVAPLLQSPRIWINDPNLATGGPLSDIGVHCIDTLRSILGDEVESVGFQAQYDSHAVLEASASGVLRVRAGNFGEHSGLGAGSVSDGARRLLGRRACFRRSTR